MKIKDLATIEDDRQNIWAIDDDGNDLLNWSISPIIGEVIPKEGHYLVKGLLISKSQERKCWLNINTPEMIADFVFITDSKHHIINSRHYSTLAERVVPSKLSNCFTAYNLYYTRVNPEIGIQVLRDELDNVVEKGYVYEYLGYIFRDENRIQESIRSFSKVIEIGLPSSEFIYEELSKLYEQIGEFELARKYLKMKQ